MVAHELRLTHKPIATTSTSLIVGRVSLYFFTQDQFDVVYMRTNIATFICFLRLAASDGHANQFYLHPVRARFHESRHDAEIGQRHLMRKVDHRTVRENLSDQGFVFPNLSWPGV